MNNHNAGHVRHVSKVNGWFVNFDSQLKQGSVNDVCGYLEPCYCGLCYCEPEGWTPVTISPQVCYNQIPPPQQKPDSGYLPYLRHQLAAYRSAHSLKGLPALTKIKRSCPRTKTLKRFNRKRLPQMAWKSDVKGRSFVECWIGQICMLKCFTDDNSDSCSVNISMENQCLSHEAGPK